MDKDDRFKHLATDPKFRRIPRAERKVKIDKRFQSMFKDEKFKVKYTVDKRGRPVNHNSAEDLKRYYELDSDDEDEEEDEDEDEEKSSNEADSSEETKDKSNDASEDESDDEEENTEVGKFVRPLKNDLTKTLKTDKVIPDKVKKKLKNLSVDYARGEGTLVSESSSDDDSESEEVSDTESVDHGWGELDKDAERTDEVTNRLAVCNQDWDRIRAVDLMVLFTSFVPSGGVIESVTIYPSDFGLERLKEEEIKGPIELVEAKKKYEGSDDEEGEEGSKYHMELLRQYQLNRLKYYYAIVVCDTPETANKIYTECDGLEYESSATKIDLRFVPDGTEFENAPKDVCDKIPEKYQPRFFTTTALQQAKVELTWDETNPERAEVAKKLSSGNIDDVTDADLQAYLASSSGEESEEEQEKEDNSDSQDDDDDNKNPIDKYRALLNDIEKHEKEKENKGVEMEITWGLNLKEKTEKLVKKKLAENEDKTPFEQYLDKRKEKRKAKREERKKKQAESGESDSEDSDIPSDIDMNDPYFAEEFNKPEFKKKKSKSKNKTEENPEQSEQEKAELELLLLNEEDDTRKHFSLKKIQDEENQSKKKRKKRKQKGDENGKDEDNFEVDVKDDRFSALFSSHHYNIDPTDPHFKKTKAMEKLIEEKLKRRNENDDANNGTVAKKPKIKEQKDAELSVLVKNIKRKTKNFGAKK